MINIAMRSQGAIDRGSLSSINTLTHDAVQAQTIHSLNTRKGHSAGQPDNTAGSAQPHPSPAPAPLQPQTASDRQQAVNPQTAQPQTASAQRQTIQPQASPDRQQAQAQASPAPVPKPTPPLQKTVQKGQKAALTSQTPLHTLKACLGWNTTNAQCDVDVSAFLLDGTGKVPGDDWFVFYGQTESPDHSTVFCPENTADRESITVHLDKLNPSVKKIVFVLTIHEALEKNLHFGMVQDAYIRILNDDSQEELVSFQMDEYYTNVISMMIGEIYLHNGIWKFNAVGSGVAKDLSGLCGLYGVQVES